MFNDSLVNDSMIKQSAEIPYEAKDKQHALEEQNTIVISNKKGFWARLKQLFKRNKNTN